MNLLTQSFWRDEAFTAILIRHNPLDIIKLTAHDSTPPLYYLLLWGWSQVFGDSEVALRSLSVIFVVGTVVVAWRIGRELKLRNSWMVGMLAFTQPILVQYAFEARAYALLSFLTAISTLLFLIKWRLEKNERPAVWVNLGLALTLSAILYTHIFGAWVVLVFLGWAIVKKLSWWWLVVPWVLYLPWVPQILGFSSAGGALPYTLDFTFAEQTLLLLGTPILVLALPWIVKLLKNEYFLLFATAWIIPIVGTAIYSKLKQFLFLDRYLIETIIPMLLMLGMTLRERLGVLAVGAAILIQGLVAVFLFNQVSFASPELSQINQAIEVAKKQPFRDLAEYVKSNEQTGDLIVNATPLTYFEAHYYGLNSIIYNPRNNRIPTYLGTILIDPKDNVTAVPTASRYWVISSEEGGGSSKDPFPGKLISTKTFGRINLSLYAKS